jgi:hypothetical protein
VISVSDLGDLVALSVDGPGAWTDAEAGMLLHPDDAYRIRVTPAQLGYLLVPEEPLRRPYDGARDPHAVDPAPTWWTLLYAPTRVRGKEAVS